MSDTDIQDIVDIFNLTYLEDVYIRLGLTSDEIENEKLTAEVSPKAQAKQVLTMLWLHEYGDKATRQNMIKAMEERPDLTRQIGVLKKKWAGRLTFLKFLYSILALNLIHFLFFSYMKGNH